MADKKEKTKEQPETIIARDKDPIEHGAIHVRAVPEKGFRRAGVYFPHEEEVVIPADTLSQERYDLIKGERLLVTVEVGAPTPKSEKKPAKKD